MKRLLWVSRHPMTNGQKSLLPILGYDEVAQLDICLGDFPLGQIMNETIRRGFRAEIPEDGDVEWGEVAIVASTAHVADLLNGGWTVYEFENAPSARQRGVFICRGVWVLKLGVLMECPCSGRAFYPTASPDREGLAVCPLCGDIQQVWGAVDRVFIPCPLSEEEQENDKKKEGK